jgi:hypothetical protein
LISTLHFKFGIEHTIVITGDMAVFEMPSSYMTVGNTNEMPQPPMPWVIQIIRNGTNVRLLKDS